MGVADDSLVEEEVTFGGDEAGSEDDDAEDALSDFDEVKPAPKPTASPITSSTATKTAQNTVLFIPHTRRLLVCLGCLGSALSEGTSGS